MQQNVEHFFGIVVGLRLGHQQVAIYWRGAQNFTSEFIILLRFFFWFAITYFERSETTVNVTLPSFLINFSDMKRYGGVEVQTHFFTFTHYFRCRSAG